ncbi:MAG: monofunctional biosynthetic peptidoglycan transglycosylase [Gammaproteobacteria bacterium]
MAAKKPAALRRLARWLRRVALTVLLASFLSMLYLRFLPPLTTSFMIRDRITTWWQGENYPLRYQWVDWQHISPQLALAVIAAEDQLFPRHWGFDARSIAKAWKSYERGGRLRGASTISQQLAKNLFLWPEKSFIRKGLEVYFTVWLELLLPKQRILEIYLNVVELGPGVFGVAAASRAYFNRPANTMGPAQAALLAAVLPNPKRLRAVRPSRYVAVRQRWILRQMSRLGGTGYLRGL